MKTRSTEKKALVLVVTAALFVFFGLGCAKEKKGGDEAGQPTPTTLATPTTPRDAAGTARSSDWAAGATATLAIDSLTALNEYVMIRPVNNPQDIAISVKLSDAGSNQYTGRVLISYFDNGRYYTGRFSLQNAIIPSGVSNGHTGKNHGAYNKWFSYNGATSIDPVIKVRTVFHGFLQDQYGAVMLIIDDSNNLGDGGGGSDLGGEIWFKNFSVSYAIQGQIPCWFIEQGPYECRTFLTDGETVSTTSALYPTQSAYFTPAGYNPNIPAEPARGWRRLGRFSGLNKLKAFGL